MEATAPSTVHAARSVEANAVRARAGAGRATLVARLLLAAATVVAVAQACQLRWSLASATAWHCDEIPLLTRSTGLCGHVTNEEEARRFQPSFYSWYMGSMRSLRAPRDIAAIHTTTNFWVNLTTHLFGVTPLAGRLIPFVFSVSAIGLAGWLTWMLVGRFTAACLAAVIVAWSPHAIAYGAQARGYAEAMALAPLLLIAMEYLRAKPLSPFRAAVVFVVTVELALTVYTAWLYWALPALIVAVMVLPRAAADRDRPALRVTTLLVALGACSLMAIYTIDRWTQLTFTGANMGVAIHSWTQAVEFATDVAQHVLPAAWLVLALGATGAIFVWRSRSRWWLAVTALGVLIPFVVALFNGSPGYPRNLGYMVVPLAALGAVGADAVLRLATRRLPRETSSVIAAVIVLGGSGWTSANANARARAILSPDWGAAVLAVDGQPETVGPRWFCPCLANHWSINWYRADDDLDRFLALPLGESFEVVLGTQPDEQGREIVFRADSAADAVVPAPLPHYLAGTPVAQTISGVDLRHWRATALDRSSIPTASDSTPVFVWLASPAGANGIDPIRDIIAADTQREVVTFKPLDHGDRVIHSLILPRRMLPMIRDLENLAPSMRGVDVMTYGMTNIVPEGQASRASETSVRPGIGRPGVSPPAFPQRSAENLARGVPGQDDAGNLR